MSKYANTLGVHGVETVVTVLPLEEVPGFDPANPPQPNTYLVPDDVQVGWVKNSAGQFVAPALTPEQIAAKYEAELDKYLDSVAKRYRFADRTRLALRAGYPNDWQALATAFGTWMDACNTQAYADLQAALAGTKPVPTVEEYISSLPEFNYP